VPVGTLEVVGDKIGQAHLAKLHHSQRRRRHKRLGQRSEAENRFFAHWDRTLAVSEPNCTAVNNVPIACNQYHRSHDAVVQECAIDGGVDSSHARLSPLSAMILLPLRVDSVAQDALQPWTANFELAIDGKPIFRIRIPLQSLTAKISATQGLRQLFVGQETCSAPRCHARV
jgi:hypothetical protein